MLHDQASRTLLRPTILRAAHQLLDAPFILDDPLAVDLIPEATVTSILSQRQELLSPRASLLRSAFVLRARFAEECIARAAGQGYGQLVILGAGLETFAWRQPSFAQGLRIFVTDHPASLAHAQEVRAMRGLVDPANVTLVPIDLEQRDLWGKLAQHQFLHDRPAIFTMLGLAQYLTPETLAHIFATVAQRPAAARLVLSHNPPDADLEGDDLALAQEAAARTATLAEPWLYRPTTEELIDQLRQSGFHDIDHLSPTEAQRTYFAQRLDQLRAPIFEQLVEART